MTALHRAALCAALLASACTTREDPKPAGEAPQPAAAAETAPEAAPPAEPVPDQRTPAQFSAAWARLRAVPVEQQGAAGNTMRAAWHNRIYTWTGYAVSGLCLDPTRTCAIHVFDRKSTPREAQLDGYFPRVTFTEEGYGALFAACKGKTGCVVTFRAPLTETTTDPAEPLHLRFTGAAFVSARDPTPDEQWFGRRADDPIPKKVPNARLRTGAPVKTALEPIRHTF